MDIIIVPISIKSNKAMIANTAINDPKLIAEIEKKIAECERNEIEVFGQKYNVIATEKGYFAAVYNKK